MGVEVTPLPAHPALIICDLADRGRSSIPRVVPDVGLGPILEGLADEPGYKNDEQIDDSLRSVLFGIPGPVANPAFCFEEPATPDASAASRISARSTSSAPATTACRPTTSCAKRSGLAGAEHVQRSHGGAKRRIPGHDPLVPPSDAIDDPHILRPHLADELLRRTDTGADAPFEPRRSREHP